MPSEKVLQQKVFRERVTSLYDLNEKIRCGLNDLSQDFINCAVEHWHPRPLDAASKTHFCSETLCENIVILKCPLRF